MTGPEASGPGDRNDPGFSFLNRAPGQLAGLAGRLRLPEVMAVRAAVIAALIVAAMAVVGSAINLAIPGFFSHDELQLRDRVADFGETKFGGWDAFRNQGFYRPLGYSLFQKLMKYGQYPMVAHAGLVAFHAINCVLVFFLASAKSRKTGFVTAALFALSPLAAFDVGWVASIYDVVCTTFLLAGLLCAFKWVRGGSRLWLVGLAGAVIAGLFTKETWIILAPCTLVLLIFARDKKEMMRIGMIFAAVGAAAALYLIGRMPGLTALGGTKGGPYSVSLSNIPGNLIGYIAFPFYLDAPEIAGVRGWNIYGWLTVIEHIAFLGAAVMSRNVKVYLASGLWYGLYLAPILSIGQASTHYLYGAGAALAFLLAALITAERSPWIARTVGVVSAGLLAFHAIGIQMSLYETGRCQTKMLNALETLAPGVQLAPGAPKPTVAGEEGSPWWVLARGLYVNEDAKGYRGKFVYQQDIKGADYHFRPDCVVVKAPPAAPAT